MSKVLFSVHGRPVTLNDDASVSFTGQLTIDADGSPRAYAPLESGLPALDYLGNAGYPGNWWGIATDSHGTPYIQGPKDIAPGYYVSTTSLKIKGFNNGDPRREVNSELVPFIVVPSPLIQAVKPVVLGCKAKVTDTKTGLYVACVVADVGPATHLGEASIATAKALNIPSNPKNGGCEQYRFTYQLWPGVAADGFTLQPSG